MTDGTISEHDALKPQWERDMKVTKYEFDKFWNEVLGDDWYIEDDDFDFPDDDVEEFEIGDSIVAYQGKFSREELLEYLPKYVQKYEFDDHRRELAPSLE